MLSRYDASGELFAGQYYDEETGLHYNFHRYYSPELGRYLTSDPIGVKGGLNSYLYANANPVMLLDKLGLAPDSFMGTPYQGSNAHFAHHYFKGKGQPVGLKDFGISEGFWNHPGPGMGWKGPKQGIEEYKKGHDNKAARKAKEALSQCKGDCPQEVIKFSYSSFNEKAFFVNTTGSPSYHGIGRTWIAASENCTITVECSTKTWSYECKYNFTLFDYYTDPFNFNDYFGEEYDVGTPYPIYDTHSIRSSGSGVRR